MKIQFFSEEYLKKDTIIEWPLPVIPRIGEFIYDLNHLAPGSIQEEYKDDDIFKVVNVAYGVFDGEYMPCIYLGE